MADMDEQAKLQDTPEDELLALIQELPVRKPGPSLSLFQRDFAWWQQFFDGAIDERLEQRNWPLVIQDMTQQTRYVEVDSQLCVDSIESDGADEQPAYEQLQQILREQQGYLPWNGPTFVKVGQRTMKDAALCFGDLAQIADAMRNSERGIEEVAIAHSQRKPVVISLRPAMMSELLGERELRVYVKHGKVHAVSTGPHVSHTPRDAMMLWYNCREAVEKVAGALHVERAWIDVLCHQGRVLVCDINAASPGTWPGHFYDQVTYDSLESLERAIEGRFAFIERIEEKRLTKMPVL